MSKYSVQAFMDSLPAPILEDEHMRQLAEGAARVMLKVYGERWKPAIYSRIDDLDEAVLDILAQDLKIDWYEYNASIETKRRFVRDSWLIHRRMGTPDAMKKALCALWPDSTVTEWFDYGGDPYHFSVILDVTESSDVDVDAIRKRIYLYKNARSVLDEIIFSADEDIAEEFTGTAICGISIVEECVMY